MVLRKIVSVGHPILRQQAEPLTQSQLAGESVQRLIDDLVETMQDARGAGLAANQVLECVQLCAIEVRDNPRYPYKPEIPLTVLVNPVLTPLSEELFDNYEGCLSVPNLRGRVLRHTEIRVQAWDRHGESLDFEVRGLSAGTYEHEVDHLSGRLFVDQPSDSRSFCTWENFERFEMARFVERAEALVKRFGG